MCAIPSLTFVPSIVLAVDCKRPKVRQLMLKLELMLESTGVLDMK